MNTKDLRELAQASVDENQIVGSWWGADQLEAECMFVADAEFVAAASPNVVRSLLDTIDAQKREINELRTALSAAEAKIRAMDGQEPVMYESRVFYAENTSTPGWGKWESVEDCGLQSAASVLFDLQEYIRRGYKYEIRPLYLAAGAKHE